jgi:hypothetical protein
MAKKRKDEYLAGRADSDQMARVNAYLAASGMNQADLVRKGVDEYMKNHPIKDSEAAPSKISKPGE